MRVGMSCISSKSTAWRGYRKDSAVEDLSRTTDGALRGWSGICFLYAVGVRRINRSIDTLHPIGFGERLGGIVAAEKIVMTGY